MKRLTPLLVLFAAPLLFSEEVTVKQPVILKAGRNLVSLKPGMVVELVSREGAEVTVKHKGLAGKIPASKLEEPSEPAVTAEATPASKPAAPAKKQKPVAKKPAESKKSGEPTPANPPRTGYGKAVQKARENAAAHDRNLVRPTDEVLKER